MYSILLVEDNPSILDMLQTVFSSMGARVSTASEGNKAFEIATNEDFDIILLDVVLPGMDGFTLLQNIRAKGITCPVIMLTDKSLMDDKIKGLNYGADDYVTKPFSTRELLARVNVQLRRVKILSEDKTQDKLVVGNLTILPDTREVRLGSEQIVQLTKTEFDLLYYLAARKEKIVSHACLLEDILHYHSDSETKALVMHIANLRKKLKKAGEAAVQLKATTGVGYRLVEE